MAKYLKHEGGDLKEETPISESTGATDAEKVVQTGADGKLDESLMPVGIGAPSKLITASETLAGGDFVNIWEDTGAFAVRKADASTAGKRAHGFVREPVTEGQMATVYFDDTNDALSELTPGGYFLSATAPGGVSTTPPTATGNISQKLGVAISATELDVEIQSPIILA